MNSFSIDQFLDLTGYEEIRQKRRKTKNNNSKPTAEFFTPYEIVKKMSDKISDEDWSNPNKTFCEPCFGNGQFVIYIIWNRLQHGIDWKTTLETLYGVELMNDNVHECKERILDLLDKLQIEYNKEEAKKIMDKNLVCHDFFTWNFEEWHPYTEEELKELNKKKK